MSLARARAAMLEDLRRPVIGRDQDIGERLVVAQQHVEARAQALDQVGFEQQRLGLGLGGDEFQRHRAGDHARDARVVGRRPRVVGDALLDVLGLADIEHLAFGVDHAVDAGPGWRVLDGARNRGAAGGERAGTAPLPVRARAARALAPRRRAARLSDRCRSWCRSWPIDSAARVPLPDSDYSKQPLKIDGKHKHRVPCS